MNGSIFYFTGTGNSLAAAEELASILDISEIIPMAGVLQNGDPACNKDVAGFVFPLYYWGLPEIVERFLAEVNLEKCSYIFAVVTRSGSKGKVFDDMKKILNEKGKNLNAGFYLTMPGNYIPMYDVGSKDKQRQQLEKASDTLNRIAGTILESQDEVDQEGVFLKAMSSIIHSRWKQKVHKKGRPFLPEAELYFLRTMLKSLPGWTISGWSTAGQCGFIIARSAWPAFMPARLRQYSSAERPREEEDTIIRISAGRRSRSRKKPL